MALKDSQWEYDCPQYFDFEKHDHLDVDDGADQFFDLLENDALPHQGPLREISNTRIRDALRNTTDISEKSVNVKNDGSSPIKTAGNRRSPRIRAQWKLVKENSSPLSKKLCISLSPKQKVRSKKRLSASYRLSTSIYNRAKNLWRMQKNDAATKTKLQPLQAKLKVHGMETRQDSFTETDYISTLRKYSEPVPAKSYARITQPEPFKLSGNQSKPKVIPFKSTAEQLIAYHTKTPERYRSKKHTPTKVALFSFDKPRKLLPTEICSPKLQTKLRRRSPTCLSQKEIEEKEIEDMKKFQFHAHPVNAAIFKIPDIGVPKIEPKPKTEFEPFNLLSEARHKRYEANKQVEEEPEFKFQARPVPKGLLEGIQGVPQMPHIKPTIAQSPNFAFKSRRYLEMSKPENIAMQLMKGPFTRSSSSSANHSIVSTTSVASSASVKWDAKPTVIKPFHFDQHDKERRLLKEKKIQDVFDEEKRLREFHANPLPKLTPSGIPAKKKKSPTKCQPFQAQSTEAGLKKAEKWKQEMEAILENQKKLAVFKAQPCNVTVTDPFVPVKIDRVLTEPKSFSLHSETRASERKEFDNNLKEKEARLQEILMQRQKIKEEKEEEIIANLRASTVHVAHAVRQYKPIVKPPAIPLTKPVSPVFQTKKRLRDSS